MSTPSISWDGTHTVIGPKLKTSELIVTGSINFTGQEYIIVSSQSGTISITPGGPVEIDVASDSYSVENVGLIDWNDETKRVKIGKDGLYLILFELTFGVSATSGIRRVRITRTNFVGTSVYNEAETYFSHNVSTPSSLQISSVIFMSADDEIIVEAQVIQEGTQPGPSVNIIKSIASPMRLTAVRLL